MKWNKVPNVYMFSKYTREDGKHTIEAEDMKTMKGTWKTFFAVYDESGEQVEVFTHLKDAKAAYAV